MSRYYRYHKDCGLLDQEDQMDQYVIERQRYYDLSHRNPICTNDTYEHFTTQKSVSWTDVLVIIAIISIVYFLFLKRDTDLGI
jgi:hypothetical protein